MKNKAAYIPEQVLHMQWVRRHCNPHTLQPPLHSRRYSDIKQFSIPTINYIQCRLGCCTRVTSSRSSDSWSFCSFHLQSDACLSSCPLPRVTGHAVSPCAFASSPLRNTPGDRWDNGFRRDVSSDARGGLAGSGRSPRRLNSSRCHDHLWTKEMKEGNLSVGAARC